VHCRKCCTAVEAPLFVNGRLQIAQGTHGLLAARLPKHFLCGKCEEEAEILAIEHPSLVSARVLRVRARPSVKARMGNALYKNLKARQCRHAQVQLTYHVLTLHVFHVLQNFSNGEAGPSSPLAVFKVR